MLSLLKSIIAERAFNRIVVTLTFLAGAVSFNPLTANAQPQTVAARSDTLTLEPNMPVTRQMQGGETHVYQIQLEADQFLHLVVEQQGVDVIVRLFRPDGAQILEKDSPTVLGQIQRLRFEFEHILFRALLNSCKKWRKS